LLQGVKQVIICSLIKALPCKSFHLVGITEDGQMPIFFLLNGLSHVAVRTLESGIAAV
jgi:hypothetical protein